MLGISAQYGSRNATKVSTSNTRADGSFNVAYHTPKPNGDAATLHPQTSGLWVYKGQEGADSLVPVEETFEFSEYKQSVQALNDIFARAYYAGRVWEAELTTRPQEGTGFFNYITPTGSEVFFPMNWFFSECPPAFFLAAEKTSGELGVDFSYTNVYTSLAEQSNTGLVKSYFRVYDVGLSLNDVIQTAQLIAFGSDRVVVTPEVIGTQRQDSQELRVSLSSLTSQASTVEAHGLANLVPARVGTFSLASGQTICRDESRWDLKAARAKHDFPAEVVASREIVEALCGVLPPEFVPVYNKPQGSVLKKTEKFE